MKIPRRRVLQGGFFALGSTIALGGNLAKGTIARATCTPTVWNLTAGQYNVVGTVTVTNDATNIYVTYNLSDTSFGTFGTLHLWIGTDQLNVPANPQGTPVPGQFCQVSGAGGACYTAPAGTTNYTFTIPFTALGIQDITLACPLNLYVYTHAEVGNETAWGGNISGTGPRWYYYGVYAVCCDSTQPPPVVGTCQTAFAKGGYVFTTDSKSNPERLPSLNLSRNRWGWAINLTVPGTTTYDIWAGAGLNKTANGTKVGTLTVIWDGTTAQVTYNLNAGYTLKEVHLYAGDFKPTTAAPGQYGNLAGFTSSTTTYTFNVNLADTNGDGVWLIAHAVVCK